ncbi:Bacterial Ig-like domain (group 2) [compost metagenome]
MRFITPFIAGSIGVLCLLTACAEEDPLIGVKGGGRKTASSTPAPSSDPNSGGIDQNTSGTATPTPPPETSLTPLHLSVAHVALTVPPNSGGTPLFPSASTIQASLDGQGVLPTWRSSDPRVATVDTTGRVTAVGAGSAIVTAAFQDREATASVAVDLKARLAITPENAPAGATIGVKVYDAANQLLATGSESLDLAISGGVLVEVEARSAGTLLGLGRWEGLTLQPNQLNTRAVSLNVPQLSEGAPNGGPGSTLTFLGGGLSKWKKRQGASLLDWDPPLQATIAGQPATIAYVSPTQIQLLMPTLSGAPARRPLILNVGGISHQGEVRLLGSLAITTPPGPMAIGEEKRFTVRALDTDTQEVSSPNVTWGMMEGEFGQPVIGLMKPSGTFTAERAGTSTLFVRSGNLIATASVTVEP